MEQLILALALSTVPSSYTVTVTEPDGPSQYIITVTGNPVIVGKRYFTYRERVKFTVTYLSNDEITKDILWVTFERGSHYKINLKLPAVKRCLTETCRFLANLQSK